MITYASEFLKHIKNVNSIHADTFDAVLTLVHNAVHFTVPVGGWTCQTFEIRKHMD